MATEALKAWYLISFSLGAWTGLTLLVSRQSEKTLRLIMFTLVSLLLLPPLNGYLTLLQGEPTLAVISINQNLTWVYGPLILLFSLTATRRKITLMQGVAHFIPFMVVCIDRLTMNQLAKIQPWLTVVLLLHVLGYVALCARWLFKNKNLLHLLIHPYRNSSYFWCLCLMGGLLGLILFDAIVISYVFLSAMPSLVLITALASGFSVFTNGISLLALYQPPFLNSHKTEDEPTPPQPEVLRNVELSTEMASSLREQLHHLCQTHQIHLDDTLSLDKLASLMGITRSQISELLNVHMETTFYDFLNQLRFKEAIELLENKEQNYSVTDIAYRAGFNNRNSFYKVFREQTGLTPTQYKKVHYR